MSVVCLFAGLERMRFWSSGASSTIRWIWRIGRLQWDRHRHHISSFSATRLLVFNPSYQLNSIRSSWPDIVYCLLWPWYNVFLEQSKSIDASVRRL